MKNPNQGIRWGCNDPSLPPVATQQVIVAEIEAEQALVAANRGLIARFEKKIQATLARAGAKTRRRLGVSAPFTETILEGDGIRRHP